MVASQSPAHTSRVTLMVPKSGSVSLQQRGDARRHESHSFNDNPDEAGIQRIVSDVKHQQHQASLESAATARVEPCSMGWRHEGSHCTWYPAFPGEVAR